MEFPSGREQKSSGDCARQDIVKSAQQSSQAKTYTDRFAFVWGTRFLAIVESRFPHGQARLVRSHFCASSLCGPARLAESFSAMPSSAAPAHRLVEEAAWKKAVMFAATERRRCMTKSQQRRRTTVRALQPRRPSSRELQSSAIRRIRGAAAEAGSHANWFVTIVELLFGWRTRPGRPHQRPP